MFEAASLLPEDWRKGAFLGRIQAVDGPTPVLLSGGVLFDMTPLGATVSELVETGAFDPCHAIRLGSPDALQLALLSPLDLQCIKAAGVTFALSAIERVIEEQARGDAAKASEIRSGLEARIGGSIRSVVPGSPEAATLKAELISDGMWSQYLEVAIGPDAEIFTKAPILSTVGWGAEIGVRSDSSWNNPEPEILIVANSCGTPIGAALGNDVNLRDFEGRSALLLGKAKDNNASCSIGPFIRLFDDSFTMDDVRNATVELVVEGADGYRLSGTSSMSEISRDPEQLVAQAMSEHQYPDGFALFLGTLFAPTQDRDEPGRGFTHKVGDVVTIRNARLGTLVNRVTTSKAAPPWTFGVGQLIQNLASRGLLPRVGLQHRIKTAHVR